MKAIMRDEREMKDCGIQWLGNIPNHWKVGRVKQAFYSNKTIVGDNVDNYERLALTLNGVIKRSKEDNGGLQPEKFEGYQVIQTNELVFKLIDLENVATSRVGLSPYTGIVSPAYIVLHHRKEKCPRYAEYYFLSMWMHEIFNHLGGDGVRSNISTSVLLKVPYLLIPSGEQEVIANYLDDRCSKIDTIIAEAKASIEEYKELKLAVIYEAVTKGVNKNPPCKAVDSQWVEKIPIDWKKIKIHYLVDTPVIDGPHVSPELVTEGIPYISANAIENGKINFDKKRGYITQSYNLECQKRYKPQTNDILVVKLGASTGKMAMVGEYTNFNIWVPLAVVRCKKELNAKFIFYAMQSEYFQKEIQNGWTYGTQETLGVNTLDNLYVFIPPRNEQDAIVSYLDKKITLLDGMISEKQSLIEDLESYKKSLIYEVVTGKRKVVA